MTLPVALFYGNCQAQQLAYACGALPGMATKFNCVAMVDFPDRITKVQNVPSQDVLDRCEILFLQMGRARPEPDYAASLAARGAKVIRFPNASCPPLWPQEVADQRNQCEPAYPFGRYPYGDRVLLNLMEAGKPEEDALDEYFGRDIAADFQIERVLEYWHRSLQLTDERSDFAIGPFVKGALGSTRLFYTTDHPGPVLMAFLLTEIVRRAWGEGAPRAYIDFATSIQLSRYMTPVHPSVARALKLEWWSSDMLYQYFDKRRFTAREFALRYLRYA